MLTLHRGFASLTVALALTGVVPNALAGPCEPPLALSECDLLVTSRSGVTGSVLRYDGATGDFRGEFVAAGSGGLVNPIGLVFGADDSLYVSDWDSFDTESRGVIRYDGESGDFLDPFTAVILGGLRVIVFGPDGDLYGATGSSVVRFDGTTGAFIDIFVDLGLGEFTTGLAFRDGELYVGSYFANEVLHYDATTGASSASLLKRRWSEVQATEAC